MAFTQDGRAVAANQAVEATTKSARVALVQRTVNAYCASGTTGTIGAALAANSSVFAMRLDPTAPRRLFLERLRLQFTTIVAFTTPVTAGRRLSLFRGNGAAASGGTAMTPVRKSSAYGSPSEVETSQGGDIRIAAAAALTVTGITFETPPIGEMSLVHVGAAGGFFEQLFEFAPTECAPIWLEPGQLLAVRNPVAFDAAGTWQLAVKADWHEARVLDDSGSE